MSHIYRRPGVDDDIYKVTAWLLPQSESVARRFVDAAQATLKRLAGNPGIGSLKNYADPELQEIRSWPIEGFKNYLIYYRILEDGIDVLAVMYGARDIASQLRKRV